MNKDAQKVVAVSNHSVLFLPLVPGPGSFGARTVSLHSHSGGAGGSGGGRGGSVVGEDNQNPSSLVSLAVTGWSLQGIMLSSEGVELNNSHGLHPGRPAPSKPDAGTADH